MSLVLLGDAALVDGRWPGAAGASRVAEAGEADGGAAAGVVGGVDQAEVVDAGRGAAAGRAARAGPWGGRGGR